MIGLLAVLIALTAVFTLLIRIPTPARGYVNLSDVAITFAGLTFGPWVGGIVGGLGTAIADLLGGFAPYAPISFVAHGRPGCAGRVDWVPADERRADGPRLVGRRGRDGVGYLVGGALYLGLPTALLEVPLNAFQALVGGLLGIPLVLAVRKAYPQIDRIGQRQTWTE